MRVIITSARRFQQTPDGKVWTPSSDDYRFWQRYLAVFDTVLIIGRNYAVDVPEPDWKAVTGPNVNFVGILPYTGVIEYAFSYLAILRQIAYIIDPCDAVILRIPSHVANIVETVLRRWRQPYGVEVIGDTAASLSAASMKHLLRPLLRFMSIRTVKRQCRNAKSIAYVTRFALQQAYPPDPNAFSTHYSSVELPDDYIVDPPPPSAGPPLTIISAGSMAIKYKRFDVLIEAVNRNIQAGLDLRLVLVGDGRNRAFFEACAADLGDRVQFLGELPGSDYVREHLLTADLFVLASANEGLPRVVIEAMAAGLPCIATTVGGTPELLPPNYLVPPDDVDALTIKIHDVATDPAQMQAMIAQNLETVKDYTSSQLSQRRTAMYTNLREAVGMYSKCLDQGDYNDV